MSSEEDNLEQSTQERRRDRFSKILSYWKKLLLVVLFVFVLCICGFFSWLTVYVIQSVKYKRLKKGLETTATALKDGLPSSPLYAYLEPILVQGRTVTPNSVDFRVSVVLGYNEGDLEILNLLQSQRLMIQDQIRMNIAMRTTWPLDFLQEPGFKAELKEWLNILLSGEYIQEIFFTDMQ